jgi:hypothetical protein
MRGVISPQLHTHFYALLSIAQSSRLPPLLISAISFHGSGAVILNQALATVPLLHPNQNFAP